jgi:hypothetical protein
VWSLETELLRWWHQVWSDYFHHEEHQRYWSEYRQHEDFYHQIAQMCHQRNYSVADVFYD